MGRASIMHKVATEAPIQPPVFKTKCSCLRLVLLFILFVDQKRNAIKAKAEMHALDIASLALSCMHCSDSLPFADSAHPMLNAVFVCQIGHGPPALLFFCSFLQSVSYNYLGDSASHETIIFVSSFHKERPYQEIAHLHTSTHKEPPTSTSTPSLSHTCIQHIEKCP